MIKLRELLSSDVNSPSSKRYIAIIGFWVIVLIVIADMVFKKTITEFLFWGLIGLVSACLGLNTLSTNKAISANSQVASDIAKNNPDDPAATKAKEVIEDKGDKTLGDAEIQTIETEKQVEAKG